MSTTIDNKVVSMEFQNDRFEKNIAQTQSSIERLKKSLKFDGASKGFEELQKSADKVDLNTIAQSIDNINSRFNVMTYAAASAVANITDRFVNMGINLGKSLSIDQLAAGWDKYNEKTANVQTIMNSTGKSIEEVNGILSELQWFSDETSYSFTQMTKAFADMTSKGGEADKVKDMVMGIAEATAFAGKTGNEFSRVIYNLSQAYGSKLLVKDWMSIENAGVNSKQLIETLIAAGEAEGTIKKGAVSVATFRDSLSDGWVTSKVMETGFSGWASMMKEAYRLVNDEHAFDTAAEAIESLEGKYDDYIEKATKAAQSAKTFSEVIDATKDAVSSQWSRIWESIFGNYEQATELWTEVVEGMWTAFAEPMSNTADAIEKVMGANSAYDDFTERLKRAGIEGETFRKELVKIGVETGALTQEAVDAEESIGALFNGEKGSWLTNNIIVTALQRFRDGMDGVSTATSTVTTSFEELESVAKRVIRGEFGVGVTRMEALEKAGYKAAAVQDIVNKMMYGQAINAADYADALIHLTDEQGNNIELTEEQITELDKLIKETGDVEGAFKNLVESMTKPSGRELLIDSFRLLIQNTWAILERFKESYRNMFPKKTTSELYGVIESFHNFAESLVLSEESLDKLSRAFDGLFASIDIVLKLVSIPFRFALKVLDVVLRAFGMTTLDVAANVGDAIVAFREWLLETGPLAKAFDNTAEFVGNVIVKIKELWGEFKELPAVQKTIEFFGKAWDKIVSVFKELKTRIDAFRKSLKGLKDQDMLSFKSIWSAFKTDILHDFQDISDWFEKLKESGSKVADAFSNAFDSARIKTGSFLDKLREFGSSMLDAIFGGENGDSWGAPEVVAILSGVAVAKLTSAFTKAIRSFEGLSGAAEGVLNSISGMFKNLAGIFKSFKYQVWTMGLLNIAKSILFLAGAVFILAKIPADDLDRAIKGIRSIVIMFGALTAVIAGLSILVNKFGGGGFLQIGKKITGKSGGFFALAMTVVAMATALLAMAGAFKLISGIDTDILWNSVYVMSTMLAVLTTFATLANIYSTGMAGGAVTILAMGIAMKSMAKAMTILADLLANDKINWAHMYGSIILMGLILAGLASILGKVTDWKAGVVVVGLAISFRLLVKSLEDLGDIDASKVRKNFDILLDAILALIAIMAATRLLGENVAKAGGGIIGIVAGLALLVFVVKMTQDMEPEQAWHTIKLLMPLIIAIGVLMVASYLTGKYAARAGALIAATGFALILMAVAIKSLASMSESDLWKATKILIALEAMLAVLVIATTDIKSDKFKTQKGGKAGPILAIGIVIAILAILLYLITKYGDLDKFDAAVKSLSLLIASIAALLFAVSKLDSVKIKIGTLMSMVVVLAVLGSVVAGLSWIINGEFKPSQLIAVTGAITILAVLMLAITFALKKFSQMKISTNWQTAIKRLIPAFALITILMALVVGVTHTMNSSVSSSQLLGLAVTVSILASVVVGLTLALNTITKSKAKPNIGKTLSALIPSFAVVALLLAGLVLLSKEFNTGMSAQQMIGLATAISILAGVVLVISGAIMLLGAAGVGSIIAGLAGLVVVLEGLVAFALIIAAMYGIQAALEAIYGPKLIEKTKQLVEVMDYISQAIAVVFENVVAGLLQGVANGLTSLGIALESFGQSLDKSGLDGNKIKVLVGLAAALATLTAAELVDGLVNLLDKLPGLDFGFDKGDFEDLGKMIGAFNDATKDIKGDRAKTLSTIAQSAADVAVAVTKIGSDTSMSNLEEFPDAATSLAQGLVKFGQNVADVDVESVQRGVDAGNLISDFQHGLYGSGGVLQLICGEKDMSVFGSNMVDLAEGLVGFSETVTGADSDNVQYGVDLANKIADIDIDNIGGVISWFAGKDDIGTFGDKLSDFAEGLTDYIDALKDYKESDFDKANAAADLANRLKDIKVEFEDLDDFLSDETADLFDDLIEKIDNYCSTLIDTIAEYYSDMESAGKEFINAFFDGAMGISDDVGFSSFARNVADNIASNAHNLAQSITTGVNIGIAGIRAGSLSGNVNIDMSQLNGTLTLLNSKLNGTMRVDLHEVTAALADIKGLMTTQNDILRGLVTAVTSNGDVYLDGKILVGYVDRKLGNSTGPR